MKTRVKTNIQFSVATQCDDSAIRRLLRDNPMPGAISLSLEREPNYFADAHQPDEIKQTIVARESGRVVCVGNCTTRLRFVNGQPSRVGYLGGLRLDTSVAGRFDILRRGYEFFHELQASNPADYYFTSITADNHRARNFLERNLTGMPHYELIGEFVTLLVPAERRLRTQSLPTNIAHVGVETGALQRASHLNAFNQHYQFAPHWTVQQLEALASLGLSAQDFFPSAIGKSGQVSAAIWDQRPFKQIVIRGYSPWLGVLRAAINLVARVTRKPRLPAVGVALSHAFVSHCTSADLDHFRHLRRIAAERGIEWLTLGFAANDPRLPPIRQRFRCREYRSRLYVVNWPGLGAAAAALDKRSLAPEVALL